MSERTVGNVNNRPGRPTSTMPSDALLPVPDRPKPIALSTPDVGNAEREALLAALESNWDSSQTSTATQLEQKLCAVTGAEAAVAVSSGTAALHLGLVALGVTSDDAVIVPSMASVELLNAVRQVGAEAIFVDCDPLTGNLDPQLLHMALRGLVNGHRTPAAVIAADVYGSCADYGRIEEVCRRHSVPMIEDATTSLGATQNDRPAGSFGDLAAVSFDNDRLVTGGGGGALLGPTVAIERIRDLATSIQIPNRRREGEDVRFSYTLSNLLAAVACAQLGRLDQIVDRARSINNRYRTIVEMLPSVSLIDIDHDGRGSGWLSVALLDQRVHPTPSEVSRRMALHNIEARPVMEPLHLRSPWVDNVRIGGEASEWHHAAGLCLPSGVSMTTLDQERVISSFIAALRPTPDPLESAAVIDLNPEIDIRTERPQLHQEHQVPSQRAA